MKKSERIVLEQFYHGALKDYLEFSNQGRRPLVLYQATLHDAVCFGLAFTLLKRKDGSLRKQGEVEKWYTQRALVLSETSGGVEELIGEEHNAINIFWTSDVDSKDNSSKREDEGAYKIDLEYVYQSDSYSKPQGLDTAQWHEMVRKKRDEERKENGFPLFLSRDEWEILIREKVEEARKQGMPYWIPREVRDRLFGTDFVGTYLPIKNQEARGSSVPGK